MTDDLAPLESSDFNPASMPASSLSTFKVSFYRRPWFLILVSVLVVVAVSIISDLPTHSTKAQDRTTQNETITAINGDLAPCIYAVKESFNFYNESIAGSLSAADLAAVPGQLVNDQTACSFASGAIYDLTNNIEVTDSPAGRHVDQMLADVVTWSTSDALAAIEDIQNLFVHPGDEKYIRNLTKREAQLNKDRQAAFNDIKAASRIDGTLKNPSLPVLPHLSGT